jgi:hypothetical protein
MLLDGWHIRLESLFRMGGKSSLIRHALWQFFEGF